MQKSSVSAQSDRVMHFDDALDVLIKYLAAVPDLMAGGVHLVCVLRAMQALRVGAGAMVEALFSHHLAGGDAQSATDWVAKASMRSAYAFSLFPPIASGRAIPAAFS